MSWLMHCIWGERGNVYISFFPFFFPPSKIINGIVTVRYKPAFHILFRKDERTALAATKGAV